MTYKFGDGSRSDELVRLMIPVLVLWAKYSWSEFHSYSELMEAVKAKSPRLGRQLGLIDDIFKQLSARYGKDIPTLNALVANAGSGLPSNGFDYVDARYSSLSKADKETLARGKNQEAHDYDYTWVLDTLGLKLPTELDPALVEAARKGVHGMAGGEGEAHRALKLFVADHPEKIGIKNHISAAPEHGLVSGDKIDVLVRTPDETWAVEVKSHKSDEQDILRGIYQCVKYKAVLEAEKVIEKNETLIKSMLVLGGALPPKLREIADYLNVPVIDGFAAV